MIFDGIFAAYFFLSSFGIEIKTKKVKKYGGFEPTAAGY
jgi:hypothetical protein